MATWSVATKKGRKKGRGASASFDAQATSIDAAAAEGEQPVAQALRSACAASLGLSQAGEEADAPSLEAEVVPLATGEAAASKGAAREGAARE
eukprot:3864338-Prymnesium_polylepis.1